MALHMRVFLTPTIGLLAFASLAAQQRPSASTATPATPAGPAGVRSPKQEPCWEQAGISKSVLEQRRAIQESVHSQIQAVCNEPNLSQQQKHERIREIRQTAHQKVDALVPAAERQKLEACRRSHGGQIGGMHPGGHGAGSDPCAGLGR